MTYKVFCGYSGNYLSNGQRDDRGFQVETKIEGQLCCVNGVVGRIWNIRDSESHNEGHGVSDEYGYSTVIATPDMEIVVVDEWSDEVIIL